MYNTPIEIHIAIDQALQYINTNRKQVVRDEEKDWLFNETMMAVIDNIISANNDGRGFEDDILTYDALRPLKVSRLLQPVSYEDGIVKYRLPSDYKNNNSIGLRVKPTCYANSTVTSTTHKKVVIDLGDGGSSPFYEDFSMSLLSITGNQTILETNIGSGYTNTELKYIIIERVLQFANNNPNIDIYWERFNNEYHPNSFIIYTTNSNYTSINITYTGTDSTVSFTPVTFTYVDYDTDGFNKSTTVITTEAKYDMLDHMFATTDIEKPLITLDNDFISVYTNSEFSVYGLVIDYIKNPIFLNKPANVMTDLTNISREIVQRTVQAIKARTNDSNYQAIINENMLNKNL